jgi:hypothetical protein
METSSFQNNVFSRWIKSKNPVITEIHLHKKTTKICKLSQAYFIKTYSLLLPIFKNVI